MMYMLCSGYSGHNSLITIHQLQVEMSIGEDDLGWYISGPMELSNMTEVKLAISGEEGDTFLPKNVLGYYDYLRSVAIDNMQVHIPLGDKKAPLGAQHYGYSHRIRLD